MTRSHKLLLIIFLAMASLLSSCATMFHRGPAEVHISGPDSMRIMTFDSVELGISGKILTQIITPPRGSDSLLLEYKGKRHTAYLEKRANPNLFLNFLVYGFGFGIDDLTQSWFDYRYLTAVPDSNNDLHVYVGASEQKALYDRPRFLIMGGEVLSWREVLPGTSSISFPGGSAYLDFEAAAGLDLYDQMQIFYRTRSSISQYNNYEWGPTGSIVKSFGIGGVNGVAVRMLRDHFFIEGSYNWSTITSDPYYYSNYNQYNSPITKNTTLVGGALGVSGDISYVSLEYMMETRPFTINQQTYSYRRLTLTYGVNWKF